VCLGPAEGASAARKQTPGGRVFEGMAKKTKSHAKMTASPQPDAVKPSSDIKTPRNRLNRTSAKARRGSPKTPPDAPRVSVVLARRHRELFANFIEE